MKPMHKSQSMGELNLNPSSPTINNQPKLPDIARFKADNELAKIPSLPIFGKPQIPAIGENPLGMNQFAPQFQNGMQQSEELKLANKFQELIDKKKQLQSELTRQKQLKANNAIKDQLYSKVKDAIEKEIEERQTEKKEK